VVGVVEVDADRVDDGKCAMASPRAVLSAQVRDGEPPSVESLSQHKPGRGNAAVVYADEGPA
jgi:hypothetical protein